MKTISLNEIYDIKTYSKEYVLNDCIDSYMTEPKIIKNGTGLPFFRDHSYTNRIVEFAYYTYDFSSKSINEYINTYNSTSINLKYIKVPVNTSVLRNIAIKPHRVFLKNKFIYKIHIQVELEDEFPIIQELFLNCDYFFKKDGFLKQIKISTNIDRDTLDHYNGYNNSNGIGDYCDNTYAQLIDRPYPLSDSGYISEEPAFVLGKKLIGSDWRGLQIPKG